VDIAVDFAALVEEMQIRRLAQLYARAMDHNEPEILSAIFTEDAVLSIDPETPLGPPFHKRGHAEICTVPSILKAAYLRTHHVVRNQTVTIDGNRAAGETYCIAAHLFMAANNIATVREVTIRYQDRYLRENGQWRYTARTLEIDWWELRPVNLPDASAPLELDRNGSAAAGGVDTLFMIGTSTESG